VHHLRDEDACVKSVLLVNLNANKSGKQVYLRCLAQQRIDHLWQKNTTIGFIVLLPQKFRAQNPEQRTSKIFAEGA
jgi:hypothetical protein